MVEGQSPPDSMTERPRNKLFPLHKFFQVSKAILIVPQLRTVNVKMGGVSCLDVRSRQTWVVTLALPLPSSVSSVTLNESFKPCGLHFPS